MSLTGPSGLTPASLAARRANVPGLWSFHAPAKVALARQRGYRGLVPGGSAMDVWMPSKNKAEERQKTKLLDTANTFRSTNCRRGAIREP